MPVVATSHVAILEAIIARLIAQIDGLNESTCFLSDAPEPAGNVSSNLFVTISPTDSQFGQEEQIGAGNNQLFEYANVHVTIWSKAKLDRVDQAKEMLTHDTRGLLVLKAKILKALVGHNLQVTGGDAVIEYIRALGCSPLGYTQNGMGRLTITFTTSFLWDLS